MKDLRDFLKGLKIDKGVKAGKGKGGVKVEIGYKAKTALFSFIMILLIVFIALKVIYQPGKQKIEEIVSLRKKEEERNKLLKEVDKYQRGLEKYRRRLSTNTDTSYFVNQISKLAKESGVEIVSIIPGTLKTERYYQKLDLSLLIKATYNQVGIFVSKLENSMEFISIEEVNILREKGLSTEGEIKAEVEIRTSLLCKQE